MSGHRTPEVTTFTEAVVQQPALAWLEGAGWQIRNGAEIALGVPAGLTKPDESVGGSRKFARYLPFSS